jgi:esterase
MSRDLLAFKEFGSHGAPVVVLLHGLLGSGDNWHPFAKSISDRFHCIVPDLTNHGESPHVDRFDYESMASDALSVLDMLGIETARFVGHSMGGKVAMEIALSVPERVHGLVVEDMVPGATSPRYRQYVDALLSLDLSKITSRRDAESLLEKDVPDRTLRLFLLKNLTRTDDGAYRMRANLKAISGGYDRIWAPLAAGRRFHGAALFVRGGRSDTVVPSETAAVRSYFPSARIESVEAAGHWIHATFPDEFSSIVVPFLEA